MKIADKKPLSPFSVEKFLKKQMDSEKYRKNLQKFEKVPCTLKGTFLENRKKRSDFSKNIIKSQWIYELFLYEIVNVL